MTAFSFSTGNPSNLTGGATASMTDISGSLTDLKTFLNGGSITDTNVQAAGLTDTSLASPTNGVWRPIATATSSVFAGQTVGTYWAQNGNTTTGSGAGGSGIAPNLFFPSASDVAVTGKTTRLRVVVGYAVNAAAPGTTLTFGLHPVSSVAGGGGLVIYILGSALSGSTAAVTTPSANTFARAVSTSFDYSTASSTAYTAGVALAGTVAASSVVQFTWTLEMRHT